MLCHLPGFYYKGNEQGWPEPYIYVVYGRIFGDFPAKNAVYKPYIGIWFWPTLGMSSMVRVSLSG